MKSNTLLAIGLIFATIAACDSRATPPAPPTPGPMVARIALPYAVTWQRVGVDRPSLAAYPAPATEGPGETPYP